MRLSVFIAIVSLQILLSASGNEEIKESLKEYDDIYNENNDDKMNNNDQILSANVVFEDDNHSTDEFSKKDVSRKEKNYLELNDAKEDNEKSVKFNEEEATNGESIFNTLGMKSDSEILRRIVGQDYNRNSRPLAKNFSISGKQSATVISVSTYIRSISNINTERMEYNVELVLRQTWIDPRLAFGYNEYEIPEFISLNGEHYPIWIPDTFFNNENKAHKHTVDKPNISIRIYQSGMVLYSTRLSLIFSCPMNFQNYPMDIQTCYINIASYGYSTNDIVYKWVSESNVPVALSEDLHTTLSNYDLINISTTSKQLLTSSGEYSSLKITLIFKYIFCYHLIHLFIPSVMLVIISWISFWLHYRHISLRIIIVLILLLTMTIQASFINAKSPASSYVKALDVWFGVSILFLFCALIECICIAHISQVSLDRENTELAENTAKQTTSAENQPSKKEKVERQSLLSRMKYGRSCDSKQIEASSIDFYSRVFIPVFYTIFVIIYWQIYAT